MTDVLISYRLQKMREALSDAQLLAAHQRWAACANRLYYACYYAVLAVLHSRTLSAKTHSGVRRLLGKEFVARGLVSKDMAEIFNTLF
jgi:uncharacterized protein (UPF0332 family)